MSMEGKFHLDVVAPNRQLVSDDVDEVTAPGAEGEFGVLAGHTPYLTELGMGVLMYKVGGEEKYVGIRKGFAEVTREKVTILAEEADLPKDIDLSKAQAELEEAQKELISLSSESKEYLAAQAKIDRALNRISLAKMVSKR